MLKITTKRIYDDLPIVVMADDGKLYQLNYYDTKNRFRKYKIIEPKKHNGSIYYRIGGERYSEYKLAAMSRRCIKIIDLTKKVIRKTKKKTSK